MKKLFKNKKLMAGVITVMVGITILLAGIAYAWFFGSGIDETNATGETDDMDVVCSLDADTEVFYRAIVPGDEMDGIGWIQPEGLKVWNGSTGMLVKLNFDEIQLTDAAGDPVPLLADSSDPTTAVITLGLKEDGYYDDYIDMQTAFPMGCWYGTDANGDWVMYQWCKGDDGDYYVEIFGNDTLHFGYTVEASGRYMTNKYRNVDIDLNFSWNWIQLGNVEKALKDLDEDFEDPTKGAPGDGFAALRDYILAGNEFYDGFMNWFYDAAGNLVMINIDVDGPLNPITPFSFGPAPKKDVALLTAILAELPVHSVAHAVVSTYLGLN